MEHTEAVGCPSRHVIRGEYLHKGIIYGIAFPKQTLEEIEDFNYIPDDIILATYPKTGTWLYLGDSINRYFFDVDGLFSVIGIHVYPDSKIHGANIGPTWVLSAPRGPHVDPMNLAIRVNHLIHAAFLEPGVVSLTFRELSKTFSQKYTMHKNHIWWEFQAETLCVWPKHGVPKAWLWAHVQSFSWKFS